MLNSLLVVFIGGGVGSVLRWAVSMKMNPLNAPIPLGTLVVNLWSAALSSSSAWPWPHLTV